MHQAFTYRILAFMLATTNQKLWFLAIGPGYLASPAHPGRVEPLREKVTVIGGKQDRNTKAYAKGSLAGFSNVCLCEEKKRKT